jgi:hypothetical protein
MLNSECLLILKDEVYWFLSFHNGQSQDFWVLLAIYLLFDQTCEENQLTDNASKAAVEPAL